MKNDFRIQSRKAVDIDDKTYYTQVYVLRGFNLAALCTEFFQLHAKSNLSYYWRMATLKQNRCKSRTLYIKCSPVLHHLCTTVPAQVCEGLLKLYIPSGDSVCRNTKLTVLLAISRLQRKFKAF